MRALRALCVAFLLWALGGAAGAFAVERLDPPSPLRGEPCRIVLAAAGQAVTAIYRPNSETSFREPLGTSDADGAIVWTPQAAGLVTLEWQGPEGPLEKQVTVRAGGFSPVGLVIFLGAGLLLFGGAALGLRGTLRDG